MASRDFLGLWRRKPRGGERLSFAAIANRLNDDRAGPNPCLLASTDDEGFSVRGLGGVLMAKGANRSAATAAVERVVHRHENLIHRDLAIVVGVARFTRGDRRVAQRDVHQREDVVHGYMAIIVAVAGAYGPQGVRANLLVIGQVRAPQIDAAAEALGAAGEEMLESRRRSGLLQSEGTPWDVASTALYLVSPDSRWVTAQTVFVDAGASHTMR